MYLVNNLRLEVEILFEQCIQHIFRQKFSGFVRAINQLTEFDEYTRHGEVPGFCVMTSILVMRKK